MDSGDRGDDDRTFRANFTSEGAVKLRGCVSEKLKEFMGDYTDDTLVEYVIVLLKNGRRKEEAKSELNVFLGDDSDSFVSWLWDHLGSNLNLYVQSCGAHPDGVAEAKPVVQERAGRDDSRQLESESEKEKSNRSSKTSHSRERKELARDADKQLTLKSSIADANRTKEESLQVVDRTRRSPSPRPEVHRKRSRPEEREHNKREVATQATIGVPRRLLQFAVRDAVAPARPSNLSAEPSLKRLRSVVSTASEDSHIEERPQRVRSIAKASLEERPQRIRSVGKVSNAMATAIKAVAEAAKDVKKVKPSRNVFDRLGRATDVSDDSNQLTEFGEGYNGNRRELASGDLREELDTYRNKSDYKRQYVSDVPLLQRDAEMPSAPGSEYEGYDDMDVRVGGDMGVSWTSASVGNKREDSLMSAYSVPDVVDGRMQKVFKDPVHDVVDGRMQKLFKDPVQPVSVPDISRKVVVNTKINMNTLTAPQYKEAKDDVRVDGQKSMAENKALAVKPIVPLMEEKNKPSVLTNGNVKSEMVVVKDTQKMQSSTLGVYSTVPPTEDADSRSIFVNNVHFAATKDNLSRHFNKFGEVLKVVILTDPATGLPKGSAYVEFMRKEAADHALSLDGTSFMSRILKVVKKSSAPPEAASTLTWPRAARPFPFPVSVYGRIPFQRGVPNVYRARPAIKPGARSLQWKRDGQPNSTQISYPASNTVPSAVPRGLTYVRPEPKTNGGSDNA